MATDLDGLEAKLAIYAQGAGDEATFHARAIRYAAKLSSTRSSVHGTLTGKEFIELLKTKTNSEGSVASFTVFSHAFPGGVMMSSGSGLYSGPDIGYGGGSGAANIDDIVGGVNDGSIRFEDNAVAIFGGCNCAGFDDDNVGGFGTEFTEKTGVTSISSQGSVSPEIVDGKETGNLVSDKMFYLSTKLKDGSIQTTELGKTITPADYDVNTTIERVEPKKADLSSVKEN
jgi:hypothetical protein